MSVLRCKVGDLAIVVSARLEKNIGQLVEVMASADLNYGLSDRAPAWVVRTVSGRKSLHYRYLTGGIGRKAGGHVPDFRLAPLRADPEPSVVHATEEMGSQSPGQVEQ